MGIHNESGHRRLSPIPPLSELLPQLLDLLTSTSDAERSFVPFRDNDNVVLLVNNLGGVSELELSGIVAEARNAAQVRGFKVLRVLSGAFMVRPLSACIAQVGLMHCPQTSLNMPGFSITLLRLPQVQEPNAPNQSQLLSLLDDKPEVPGWKWTSGTIPLDLQAQLTSSTKAVDTKHSVRLRVSDPPEFVSSIRRACIAVSAAEPEITRMDTIAGDGDCGLTLKVRRMN
jgi:triose/dihydroxyacetone kinase / FAD-AMP lyase (cyclizing)